MKLKDTSSNKQLIISFNFTSMAGSNALEHVNYTHTQEEIASLLIELSRFAFIVFIFAKEYRKDEDYG